MYDVPCQESQPTTGYQARRDRVPGSVRASQPFGELSKVCRPLAQAYSTLTMSSVRDPTLSSHQSRRTREAISFVNNISCEWHIALPLKNI